MAISEKGWHSAPFCVFATPWAMLWIRQSRWWRRVCSACHFACHIVSVDERFQLLLTLSPVECWRTGKRPPMDGATAVMGTSCQQQSGRVMSIKISAVEALDLWRGAIVESVRREAPDLSARQMALLLTVYLTTPPHTVRGLATSLNISKPAITRAVDRLTEYGLVKRKVDEQDRRSVLIQRTVKGSVFLREFGDIIVSAAAASAAQGS